MVRARRTKGARGPAADGFLTRFIGDRLAQHVEPARRGTPRGAPVGFSRKKLTAALFAMTSADVKRTARAVGVSYGVLRKWRTEAAFRVLVERLEDEFVEAFCAAVDAALGVRGPLRDTTVPEEAEADLDRLVERLHERRREWIRGNLGDTARYGLRLIGKLTEHLLDQREGVGRPWRLAVLRDVAPLWANAGPDADLWQLGDRGSRALFAMIRFIVLVMESEAPEGLGKLARVYLRLLYGQLAGPAPGRPATSGAVDPVVKGTR